MMTDEEYDEIIEEAHSLSWKYQKSIAGRAEGQMLGLDNKRYFEYWVAKAAYECALEENQSMEARYNLYVKGKLYELEGRDEPMTWAEFVSTFEANQPPQKAP